MKNLIKQLVKESLTIEAAKQGTPDELAELLKFLPTHQTARVLSLQIFNDIQEFYTSDKTFDKIEKYLYTPEEKCLKPYELDVFFKYTGKNNIGGIEYSEEQFITIKIFDKDVENALPRLSGLLDKIYNIIKHECGHFYLRQKNVEECLYNTHPEGIKKYFFDRQEITLHSINAFDDFEKENPNWTNYSIDHIKRSLTNSIEWVIKSTNIGAPFPSALKKIYLSFIMNNFIKPKLKGVNEPTLNAEEQIKTILDLFVKTKLMNPKNYFKKETRKEDSDIFDLKIPTKDSVLYEINYGAAGNKFELKITDKNTNSRKIGYFETFYQLVNKLKELLSVI
jgi:hypothetical protein